MARRGNFVKYPDYSNAMNIEQKLICATWNQSLMQDLLELSLGIVPGRRIEVLREKQIVEKSIELYLPLIRERRA